MSQKGELRSRGRNTSRNDNLAGDLASKTTTETRKASYDISNITDDEIKSALEACQSLHGVLSRLRSRIEDEMKSTEESEHRRRLYAELELHRLDFSDMPGVQKFLHTHGHAKSAKDVVAVKQLESTPVGEAITGLMAVFDELRMKMEVRRKKAMIHFRIMHTLLCLVWCVAAMPFLYGCTLINSIFKFAAGLVGIHVDFQVEMFLQRQLCRGMLASWGVTTYWEGLEHLDAVPGSTLSLFTHQSSYDAFVVAGGPRPYSMIGKKSLFFIPLLGQLAYLWGHTPIDRTNLERAKASLNKALTFVQKTGRSFGIFPEGTRSVVGRPIDFKKGAFHTAVQSKLPISPIILYGAGELWHAKGYAGSPGEIFVRVLPSITILPNETPMELRSRVQRAVLMAYAAPISKSAKQIARPFLDFIWLPVAYAFLYVVKQAIFA